MTTAYITPEQLDNRLKSDSSFAQDDATNAFTALLTEACVNASAIVNSYVGRGQPFAFETVGSVAVPHQRTYTGDGTAVLALDLPLQQLVSADNDGTAIAAADVWLEPVNVTPARSLRLKRSAPTATWSCETYSVTVRGVWGWGAPPEDVIEAVLELAVRIVKGRNAGYSDVVGIDGTGASGDQVQRYVKALPPLVKIILDQARERVSEPVRPRRLFY